jgi:mediator of RNA polymerase II transcription subunit 16
MANPLLQQAYHKLQRTIAAGMIRVSDFEKLLTSVGNDVRQSYSDVLPNFIKQQPNAPQGKALEAAVRSTQNNMELGLLLATTSIPPPFLSLIKKFFKVDLPAFRKLTDPAQLFFANYDLLQVQDEGGARDGVSYVDVFKKEQLYRRDSRLQWRRCGRCAAVMEDVRGQRPAFAFVLSQQRKCSCGGQWGLLPKGKVSP